MKVQRTFLDRIQQKDLSGLITAHLQEHYRLPPQAAKTLCEDYTLFQLFFHPENRPNGVVISYAARVGEPAGKPLSQCEKVTVRLTMFEDADLQLFAQGGPKVVTMHVLKRIVSEAYAQHGALSQEDAAFLLRLSPRTVTRYKHEWAKQGVPLPFRGELTDMGPGLCHRNPVIEHFLQGYTITDIARRLHHSLENVEHYVHDFLRVSLLWQDGYDHAHICRLARLSRGKVRRIISLYERLEEDTFFAPALERVVALYRIDTRQYKKNTKTMKEQTL